MNIPLIDDILRDRETGTDDHWWPDRIGDYTRHMAEHGDPQDIADKARIMRLPALENALIAVEPLIQAIAARSAAHLISADRDRLLRLATLKGQTDDPRP